ncbi:sensor histidine kinase [Seonamhaeicola marinus]|nr:sensor histidine kinase [Seonamhaeicola marinus]
MKQKRWINHFVFWISLLVFYTLAMSNEFAPISSLFNRNVILLLPQVFAAYIISYFLIPKFLYKKQYILFGAFFLLCTYIFSGLARILVVHVVEGIYREQPFKQESILEIATDLERLYKEFFHRVFLPVFLFVSIKLLKERFEEKNRRELLEKEKITAELNFLKAQIHPHFLFNTLNNLYTLTLQKSDKASETVLKLSEMLDYILYKCKEKTVSIEDEIKLIKNYINLERLRYGNRLEIMFETKVDDLKTQLAPLILISFIENAFKHGASGTVTKPKIEIELMVKENQLHFSVKNTKPGITKNDHTKYKDGIGLNNTKNQLHLIYPMEHVLHIIEDNNSYKIELRISL